MMLALTGNSSEVVVQFCELAVREMFSIREAGEEQAGGKGLRASC
jgi:hypothetical protein